MPHNNRMSGSSALNTSDIWKNVIKYDPYAGAGDGECSSLIIRDVMPYSSSPSPPLT